MTDHLSAEFSSLSSLHKSAVRDMVGTARGKEGRHSMSLYTGDEVYAYQGADGKVYWGVNDVEDGQCIAQGVFKSGEALHD